MKLFKGLITHYSSNIMSEAKTQIFTQAEGQALGAAYLASIKAGMVSNDFTPQHEMMADRVAWEWSGGVVGEGSVRGSFTHTV